MINWLLGYFIIALFISMLDRYFSGEDFKKSEWINGKTFKFKLGLSLAIVMAPYFFMGFFTLSFFNAPFCLAGMVLGFMAGDFFLKAYDWAFKKPSASTAAGDEKAADPGTAEAKSEQLPAGSEDGTARKADDDSARKSVVEAIQDAGSNIKDGLKSVGEGIAKASENMFKDGDKKEAGDKEKKNYESNKKLDDKLNNY